MSESDQHLGPVYMPDGRPAPVVLLESELLELTRIDVVAKNPENTLKYYQGKGLFRPVQVSRKGVYLLQRVLEDLDKLKGRMDSRND